MTPKQAIALLDQVASMINLNRADHIKIIEAINVLTKLINKTDEGVTNGIPNELHG